MNIRETLGRRLLLLDGATGTQLQARGLGSGQTPELWNIERREDMIAIHHSYYAAGADLVLSNTFGVNRLKLRNCPYSVDELVAAALENLRAARDQAGHGWLGADIGPTGHLMAPMGDLDFDEAVASFSETIRAGAAAGADAVVIETMTDLYELKAAVLAARESCHLPVLATAAFGENGRLLRVWTLLDSTAEQVLSNCRPLCGSWFTSPPSLSFSSPMPDCPIPPRTAVCAMTSTRTHLPPQ